MHDILKIRIPFFRPLWRRVAITVFVVIWGGIELAVGWPYLGVMLLALGAYISWVFFLSWQEPEDSDDA